MFAFLFSSWSTIENEMRLNEVIEAEGEVAEGNNHEILLETGTNSALSIA